MIANEWRSPARTDASLRQIVERVERSGPDLTNKYMIAATYAFFLDDFDKARPYAQELLQAAGDDDRIESNLWNIVVLPEMIVEGEYQEALRHLELSQGSEHPTFKLFDLVLTCYLDRPLSEISSKAEIMRGHLNEQQMGLEEMILKRRYSKRLEANLLGAFKTPQCARYANM